MVLAEGSNMDMGECLGVTNRQALQFFFEHLKGVTDDDAPPASEVLYNASVLAHFASTSTSARDAFPASPASLVTVFDIHVLDRSQHLDPEIMEAAGAQCLLLTGFFFDQQRRRHNVDWYAALGMGFYERAARGRKDRERSRMMETMARRFGFWRHQQHRLARELRDAPSLIVRPVSSEPPAIM